VKLEDVQAKAKLMGVMGVSRKAKTQLIHAIQLIEGNRPCYVSKTHRDSWQEIFACGEMTCLWRSECQCGCVNYTCEVLTCNCRKIHE
jgi:hypothetical protein